MPARRLLAIDEHHPTSPQRVDAWSGAPGTELPHRGPGRGRRRRGLCREHRRASRASARAGWSAKSPRSPRDAMWRCSPPIASRMRAMFLSRSISRIAARSPGNRRSRPLTLPGCASANRFSDADDEDMLLLDDLLGIGDAACRCPAIAPDARRRRLSALINSAALAQIRTCGLRGRGRALDRRGQRVDDGRVPRRHPADTVADAHHIPSRIPWCADARLRRTDDRAATPESCARVDARR